METLQEMWNILCRDTLPYLARSKSPAQTKWPVQLDHCFARIILDAVVGRGEVLESVSPLKAPTHEQVPVPWTAKLKAPAVRNIDETDLRRCIEFGEAIATGRVDLVQLDEKSLESRGKASKTIHRHAKRKAKVDDPKASQKSFKREQGGPEASSRLKPNHGKQHDIWSALGAHVAPAPPPARLDADLRNTIENSHITEFRKRVLLGLCQVPKGQVSTYLALSNFLDSSPRAVGNALRNNPFAPRAPCHRIVAADGGIGGYGGSWGVGGENFHEKVKLLGEEGVKIGKEGRFKGAIWRGFS